jgi:hypothetical protein
LSNVVRKISDRPSGSPIKTVIQITQAMLDNRSTEDTPTRKMMPYRSQTPLQRRSKARPAESPRYQRDLNHIARFEPILSSQHQNVMHATLQGVNSED